MDMNQMLAELRDAGQKTESAFISLSDIFPQLLAVKDNINSGDLTQKIADISNGCDAFGTISVNFWAAREEAYTPMLEKLNEKVAMLSALERQVNTIRECSEEMELLSLNAMVISIKSGVQGRAFSSITESLRNLSSKMIENSARLVREQGYLIESIRSLGNVISELSGSQKKEHEKCADARESMQDILREVGRPLPEIEAKVADVWKYIVKSMETMQMQDIVRQSADQVILCLREFKDVSSLSEDDIARRNDIMAFDIQLCKIALGILKDISEQLEECIRIFGSDWDSLTEILEAVEQMRTGFINSFYNDADGRRSLFSRLDETLDQFEKILDGFFYYINAQKSLVKDCKTIKAHSRGIFIVFTDLLPVVNSLQHVRVLQKIEVAKNDAISSVRNSSDDMDMRIDLSKDTIDEISRILGSFLEESNKLLSEFIAEITQTGNVAAELKATGGEFFARLREAQVELAQTLKAFAVFPKGFDRQCAAVRAHINAIVSAANAYMSLSEELSRRAAELEALQAEELAREGLSSWQVEDDSFKEIIGRFTITMHKELAGSITGVEVEAGVEAGEVTFF